MTNPKASAASRTGMDAITMLTDDHKRVRKLFRQFEKLREGEGSQQEKEALVRQVCAELTVHARLEEEIFYPAVREAIDDDDLMDEAEVEHAGARELIEQLDATQPDDDLFDARVTVLGEQVDHHATEEEQEMFPQVRKAKVDTVELGEEMSARRQELMDEAGLDAGASRPRGGSGKEKNSDMHDQARR